MKFKITITKDVIDKSLMCGTFQFKESVSQNCALAICYNQLIPDVGVGYPNVYFSMGLNVVKEYMPQDQLNFIDAFDNMMCNHMQRYTLVGQTFDVEIPDEVIEYWHGDAVTAAQKLIDNPIMQVV